MMTSSNLNTPPPTSPRVLVIDDDDAARTFVARALTRQGFDASASEGGRQAVALLEQEAFDVIVCDLLMPEMDGLDVLRHCGTLSPCPPFIMLTAHGNVGVAVDAMKLGAADFLEKPVSPSEIDAALRTVLGRHRARKKPRSRGRSGGLVGSESWLNPFQDMLEKIADTDAIVLIEGETGTGKTAVADQIWRLSRRARGPFVAINCANMNPSLLENELFGHVKGAFTGAVGQEGKVEKAKGGTLFLDEIGELPLDMQAQLLQLLQERVFTPVGASSSRKADVRFIAATNRELEVESRAGRFRTDLYFRLEVVKLTIPPLRRRLEDIPLLLEHFRAAVAHQNGRVPVFPPETVEALGRYDWPGNVRELENLVERLSVMLGDGESVRVDHLPDRMRKAAGAAPREGSTEHLSAEAPQIQVTLAEHGDIVLPGMDAVEREGLSAVVRGYEARVIESALTRTSGNVSRAAKLLGMKRTTLIEKRKRLTQDGLL